jgi:hypothetical protein
MKKTRIALPNPVLGWRIGASLLTVLLWWGASIGASGKPGREGRQPGRAIR